MFCDDLTNIIDFYTNLQFFALLSNILFIFFKEKGTLKINVPFLMFYALFLTYLHGDLVAIWFGYCPC